MPLLRLLLAVLLPLGLGCAVVGLVAHATGPTATRTERTDDTAEPVALRTTALVVLRSWDERRSEAWARGDPIALRRLYVSGSAAGRRDVAMLRRWVARGLRVEGLQMQVVGVRVRSWERSRLALAVTDRVGGGTAIGDGTRADLPRDSASTRLVVLRRIAGEWRVARVRPVSAPR